VSCGIDRQTGRTGADAARCGSREEKTMSDHVHWVLELDIRDGQLDALKALMNEMVEATRANEPGTLHYEWFVSEDGSKCHIYERYVDSAAVMVHMGTFGQHYAKRFMALLQPTRITVYGPADEAVRKTMAPLGAVHMAEIGGFVRG
jgi:quinol monooxygenase YgiN